MSTNPTLHPDDWRPHLWRAIELMGGQAAMSRALGVAQPTVWEWLNKRRTPLRIEVVIKIEQVTKEQVTRRHLRPDVFGAEPSDSTAADSGSLNPESGEAA